MRIGHGYDVHQLVLNRPLILGGVHVPYEKGLLGHSDADVVTHAIMDALLGAMALGDIGKHFPDNDPNYAGADSIELLKHCVLLMEKNAYQLGNLDATIIAQSPKLASFLPQMKDNLCRVFSCQPNQINLKATTEEHLGFTGEGLGISSHCVCLLEKKSL